VREACETHRVSERRVCRALGQPRSTQRYVPQFLPDEDPLVTAIIGLACQYGRYGYKKITALLRGEGWRVNKKRVERIWRQEGLKVPQKQPKRRRLWFTDGSCVRLRAEYTNHVWSYDFVERRTTDGRKFRILNIVDEFSHECMAAEVQRRFKADDVQAVVTDLFIERGVPEFIRSDNGPEFIAHQVKDWLPRVGVKTLFIEPGSPWENGYIESFNGKMSFELLDCELFDTLWEARVLVGRWKKEYNTIRPHESLNMRPPAPEAVLVGPKVNGITLPAGTNWALGVT
jgi:putative transposase